MSSDIQDPMAQLVPMVVEQTSKGERFLRYLFATC